MVWETECERMERVQAALSERSLVGDRGPIVAELLRQCRVGWDSRFRCRSPACPCCRRRIANRQKREIREMFSGFENHEMAFITIVLPPVRETADLDGVLKKGKSDFRNRIRACRRASSEWNDLAVVGWVEIDAVAVEQMQFIAPERRDLLLELAPFGCDTMGPVWVPTFHAIVYLGNNTVAELRAALRQQWPLEGQTDVQSFWPNQEFEVNLDRLVGYVGKFACSTDLCAPVQGGKLGDPWPPAWEAELLAWLHSGHRNAFERLRFSIQQKRNKQADQVDSKIERDVISPRAEPLPFMTYFVEDDVTTYAMYKYNYENQQQSSLRHPPAGIANRACYRGSP